MDVQYIDLLKYFYDNYNQTIYFEEYFPSLISEPPNLKECRSIDNQAQCNQNNKCLWQHPENSNAYCTDKVHYCNSLIPYVCFD